MRRHRPSTGCPYNGWVNYETWLVALWIDNDQGLYEEARRIVREGGDLKDYIEEIICLSFGDESSWPTGLVGDLLTSALAEVEWRDIAEHLEEG